MLTFEQMKELIDLVAANQLGGVEVKEGGFHFRVNGVEPLSQPAPAASAAPVAATVAASAAGGEETAPEPEKLEGYILTSPIVGTFYLSPSPEAEPYVRPGDRVENGVDQDRPNIKSGTFFTYD